MSETRNLCTVPAGTVADETNFIVEENKELKRIPQTEVIKTKLADMTVLDLYNLLNGGSNAEANAQTFMNTLADMVANKLLKKSQLINNFLATEAGVGALDAVAGAELKKQLEQVNSDFRSTTLKPRISISGSILEAAEKYLGSTNTVFINITEGMTDLPSSDFTYAVGFIISRIDTLTVVLYSRYSGKMATRSYNAGDKWNPGWHIEVTKSDLLANNRFSATLATVSSCNDLKESGIYVASSIADRPANAISIIIVFSYSSYIVQVGINIIYNASPFIRRYNNGVWSEWTSI